MIDSIGNLIKFIYLQRIAGFSPPKGRPTMDPEGVLRFIDELNKAESYLEFGSGGTTILADRHGVATRSVESDRFYAKVVASQLKGECVHQINVDIGLTLEWGHPLRHSRRKGQKYATAPFTPEYKIADFILIDGRYRVACALECAKRAYEQGRRAILMFDDYATRPHYHRVEMYLGSPELDGRAAIFRIGENDIDRRAINEAHDDQW